ncbi:unnamed protein product [Polarella glacialis]|uniref:Acyltransferase 3 domain-containing protein n=1 Tax=Polarella glacialis TaxID=89957 RepID=A0A813J975_POLGL|nr:unnamed protein product [Polarella glacialis]
MGKQRLSHVVASKDAADQSRLDHLTGARCLASVWIVCGHFVPRLEPTVFSAARHRGNTAVNFFIVMSGFITHWVYATRVLQGGQIRRFYVRRIGRVVITTWIAMLLGVAVLLVQLRGQCPDLGHLLRCFLFVETWHDPVDWCPNGQTWTVAALLPSWLLYPLTCRAVAAAERCGGATALAALAALLWLVSFGPLWVLFVRQGSWITNKQGVWGYVWPPSQLADFALGVTTAALARRHAAAASSASEEDSDEQEPGMRRVWARGLLADGCILIVGLTCLCAPWYGGREGWEPLFNHGFGLLFAAFLYGSAAGGGSGLVARLFRHDVLVCLGAYSFEVYLFQYPVHEIFVAVGDVSGAFDMRNAKREYNNNSCGFVVFFFSLWLAAGLYAEFVESHLIRWLQVEAASGGDCTSQVSKGYTSHKDRAAMAGGAVYEQLAEEADIERSESAIPLSPADPSSPPSRS